MERASEDDEVELGRHEKLSDAVAGAASLETPGHMRGATGQPVECQPGTCSSCSTTRE